MNVRKELVIVGALLLGVGAAMPAAALSPIEELGRKIFFDVGLSANGTQSCASCHAPEVGFTGPDSTANATGAVYEGALPGRFGNRKPPASSYAGDSPPLRHEPSGNWVGGMFWDGRATGAILGDPLSEQAQGPFLNPLEQALEAPAELCGKIRNSSYATLFEQVWGQGSLDCDGNVTRTFELIGRTVAAYERSSAVNPFSSKFDRFWDNAKRAGKDVTRISCGSGGMRMGGMGMGGGGMGCSGSGSDPNRWPTFRNLGLSDAELQGLAVFNDPTQANCASCHSLQKGPQGYPLFTDFGYDNLGIPRNPSNPFYRMSAPWNPEGTAWVDYGLGGYLKAAGHPPAVYEREMGKFKVPTLRNVDLRPYPSFVKAYGHNGYFKSLNDIVLFYHWRAMMDTGCGGGMGCGSMSGMFPPPEVDRNRARLGTFPRMQVNSIVFFLKTLSDGYYYR